jgi:Domain of unknown function (DUF4193)
MADEEIEDQEFVEEDPDEEADFAAEPEDLDEALVGDEDDVTDDEEFEELDDEEEEEEEAADAVALEPAPKTKATATKTRRSDDEEEEEDDDDVDPDDVEADLDTILKDRIAAQPDDGEEDDDEEQPETDERGDGTGRIQPKRPGEFVCQSCFLVKHPSQLADSDLMLCADCV